MYQIYKKFKKSGSYHRRLKKTRERYENALKHMFCKTHGEEHTKNCLKNAVVKHLPEQAQHYAEPSKKKLL